MKKLKPLDFDLNQKDIGTYELPPEIAHLEEYNKYAKPIKEGVWGFFIPQFTKTGANNEDWYTFRYHTLGASSVATLTDHDEYGDPVKMFWEKIGMSTPKIYSKFMTAGSHFESGIADLWDFNDGTDDGWAEIWSSGKKVTKGRDTLLRNQFRLPTLISFFRLSCIRRSEKPLYRRSNKL